MKVGPTATKKSVLEELLEQGMVLVALDARVEGVEVPSHLHQDPQLRLNLSYRFGLPMDVSEWGVAATLTFAGVPFECRIPWCAIFLLVSHVSGQPYLFPDDIPAELLSAGEGAEGLQRASKLEPARPKLTLVSRDAAADDEAASASTSDDAEDEDAEHALDAVTPLEAAPAFKEEPAPTLEAATDPTPAPAPAAAQDAPVSEYAPASAPEVDVQVVDNDAPKNPRRPRGRGHLRLVK